MTAEAAADAWRYYARLERDVREVLSYVEWDVRHFPVYSAQFGLLLERAGREVDVLQRELERKGLPRLSDLRLALRRIDRSTTPYGHHVYAPFEEKAPWREAVELLRKSRHAHAPLGNFENAVKALGAALWLNLLNLKAKDVDLVTLPYPGLEHPHALFELPVRVESPGVLRLPP